MKNKRVIASIAGYGPGKIKSVKIGGRKAEAFTTSVPVGTEALIIVVNLPSRKKRK